MPGEDKVNAEIYFNKLLFSETREQVVSWMSTCLMLVFCLDYSSTPENEGDMFSRKVG
jgi:hypothetical protein